MHYFFGIVMFLTALVLIVLVLLQRGRGGGLAGAFGGLGGQSAFGAKAGDQIMWTTVGIAAFWILLCMATIKVLEGGDDKFGSPAPPQMAGAGLEPAEESPDANDESGAEPGLGAPSPDEQE